MVNKKLFLKIMLDFYLVPFVKMSNTHKWYNLPFGSAPCGFYCIRYCIACLNEYVAWDSLRKYVRNLDICRICTKITKFTFHIKSWPFRTRNKFYVKSLVLFRERFLRNSVFHWKENCKFEYMELSKGKMLNSSLAASLRLGNLYICIYCTWENQLFYI